MIAPPGTPGAATIVTPSSRMKPAKAEPGRSSPGQHRDGQGACHDLEHRSRQVDRGAERDDERRQFGTHAETQRPFERHGDRRGRRLRPECRDIGREHHTQQTERIAPRHKARHGELEEQQHHRQAEDDDDQFDKDPEHGSHLPRAGHVEKDAEDIERQQREDDPADHRLDDPLELVGRGLQPPSLDTAMPSPSMKARIRADMTSMSGGMATVK